jgi:hypothetical protein
MDMQFHCKVLSRFRRSVGQKENLHFMSRLRHALLSAALLMLFAAALFARSAANDAEYLGGTAVIPGNTIGTLDLSDSQELRFRYGKTIYRLPYSQIDGFDFSAGPRHRVFHKVTVSGKLWPRKHNILNLSVRDDKGEISSMSFALTGKAVASVAESVLETRIESFNAANGNQPDTWWGDKYWRTARNGPSWPSPERDAQTAAAGTK